MAAAERGSRVRREPQPTPEQLAEVEAIEAKIDELGLDLAGLAVLLLDILPGHVHGFAPSLPVDRPTRTRPGSPEKIRVLRHRASRGMQLFDPRDLSLKGTGDVPSVPAVPPFDDDDPPGENTSRPIRLGEGDQK